MGWFIRDVDRADYELMLLLGPVVTSVNYGVGINPDDRVTAYNGVNEVTGSTISVGTWNHMAMVVEGTGAGQFKAYLNGVLDVTHDGNVAVTAGRMIFGNNVDSQFLNGRVAAIKVWDVALTADEIKQEVRCIRPVRLASLNSGFPMFPGSGERVRDYSGLGRNLVEAGTLVDEDPPDVSWGANPILVPFAAAGGAVTAQPFMFVIT